MPMQLAMVMALMGFAASASSPAFDVRDFGAKGDGQAKNTAQIQRAVDACSRQGGGEVVFRAGRYLTGMFFLRDNVMLRIEADATLLGSADCADYPTNAPLRHLDAAKTPRLRTTALIVADECTNVGIVGAGRIDCNGQAFVELSRNRENGYVNEGQAGKDAKPLGDDWTNWKYRRKPGLLSPPRMVLFAGCRNVRVEDVTLTNPAAGWGYWVNDCDDVVFRRAKVLADPEYPNNDGIHVNASRDVSISDCDIVAGDDAIIVRCNCRMLPRPRPCERVTVRDCRLRSHANCIRIGWLNDGTIRDCLFENLAMRDSAGGIGIEIPELAPGMTDYGCEASRWEGLTFRSITMDRIYSTPVRFIVERDDANIRVDAIRNLTFSNLVCRSALRFPTFKRLSGVPFEGILFKDCSFRKVPPSALPGNWRQKGAAYWWNAEDERFDGFAGLRFDGCTFSTSDSNQEQGEKP